MGNTLEVRCVNGLDVSDGYHTFGELYEHRHALFIGLTRLCPGLSWRSLSHSDGSLVFEGWFIAGVNLPTGQISYHLPIGLWGDLEHCTGIQPVWDNHTSADVPLRLRGWFPSVGEVIP